MEDLGLVLRVHLRILRKRFGVRRWRGALGLLPGVLLVAGIGTGLGLGAFQVFKFLGEELAAQPLTREAIELNVLAIYALGTAVMVLANAFGSIHGAIWESDDNAFLFATPLRTTSIMAARLVEVCLNHLAWVGPAMLGPFIAYGLARQAGAGYYPLVLLANGAYVLGIIGLAAVLVTVVMRYVPGPRLKRLATVAMFLCLLAVMFSLNFVVFTMKTQGGPLPLLQRLAEVRIGSLELFPHVWVARVALQSATGRAPWVPVVGLLLVAGVFCGFLILSAPRLYVAGWGSSQEAARRGSALRAWSRYRAAVTLRPGDGARPLVWALARKEWLVAFRSPVFWYLQGLGFISVFFLIAQRVSRMGPSALSHGSMSFLLGALLAGASLASLILAGTSVSREGGMLPLWLAMPNHPRTVYLSKVAAWLPVPLAVTAAGLGVYSLVLPQGDFAPLIVPAVLILLAMASMVVALDTVTPRFQIDQSLVPGTGSGGQSIGKLLTAYYGVIGIAVFITVFNFPGYYQRLSWFEVLGYDQAVTVGWCGLILLSTVVTWVSYRIGVKALARVGG